MIEILTPQPSAADLNKLFQKIARELGAKTDPITGAWMLLEEDSPIPVKPHNASSHSESIRGIY
jgi:hypothetical protein